MRCTSCRKAVATKLCACKLCGYCSTECQRSDWFEHQLECEWANRRPLVQGKRGQPDAGFEPRPPPGRLPADFVQLPLDAQTRILTELVDSRDLVAVVTAFPSVIAALDGNPDTFRRFLRDTQALPKKVHQELLELDRVMTLPYQHPTVPGGPELRTDHATQLAQTGQYSLGAKSSGPYVIDGRPWPAFFALVARVFGAPLNDRQGWDEKDYAGPDEADGPRLVQLLRVRPISVAALLRNREGGTPSDWQNRLHAAAGYTPPDPEKPRFWDPSSGVRWANTILRDVASTSEKLGINASRLLCASAPASYSASIRQARRDFVLWYMFIRLKNAATREAFYAHPRHPETLALLGRDSWEEMIAILRYRFITPRELTAESMAKDNYEENGVYYWVDGLRRKPEKERQPTTNEPTFRPDLWVNTDDEGIYDFMTANSLFALGASYSLPAQTAPQRVQAHLDAMETEIDPVLLGDPRTGRFSQIDEYSADMSTIRFKRALASLLRVLNRPTRRFLWGRFSPAAWITGAGAYVPAEDADSAGSRLEAAAYTKAALLSRYMDLLLKTSLEEIYLIQNGQEMY